MTLDVAQIDPEVLKRTILDIRLQGGFENDEKLLDFIEAFWNLRIPRAQVCPGHTPPAQYICDSFFERVQDSICWANRGGGKTLLGALSTWLDAVFKKNCATKVLGGSLEQSKKMYQHLTGEGDGWGLATDDFRHLLRGEMLAASTTLINKSNINILTASSKSVRGPHPQKLKLDEIDEFDDKIFEAALLAPQTKRGIKASVQMYSTMHKSYGLMNRVITEAAQSGFKVYKWCIFCIIEKCPEWRDCASCELWEDCEGRARQADGFYSIEDAITKKRQAKRDTWLSEMLCFQPSQEGLIYKEFDLLVHVVDPPEQLDDPPEL
jgi:hypothetical protein